MSDEQAFLDAIAESPFDVSRRLVFADWLEEQGDPRATEIRKLAGFRSPFSNKELSFLEAIAKRRAKHSDESVRNGVELSEYSFPISADDPASAQSQLALLDEETLLRNFPRDDRGNLQLAQAVLLAELECDQALPRGRRLFLAATGPAKRKDGPIVTLSLEPLISANQAHDWTTRRWMWTAQSATRSERWGVPPEAVAEIDQKKPATGRYSKCLQLLDEGQYEEAFSLFDVEVSTEISMLLNGEDFQIEGCCDCMYEGAGDLRATRTRREVWELAPWAFAESLEQERERLTGRQKNKELLLRLFIVPRQKHSQRAMVTVMEGKNGPKLGLHVSGSNAVAFWHQCRRPIEMDLVRFGLESPGEAEM